MPNYVPGYGNASAKLAIVGEAPGAKEDEDGIPFAGASGSIVNEALHDGGSSREDVYLTNVVKIRPPDNNIHRLKEYGKSIDDFIPQLWNEIDAIKPNCILALGETALNALTGLTGIRKYRGSILPNKHSGLPKVVPCLHPATLFHQSNDNGGIASWKELVYIKADFKKAIEQSKFKALDIPQRTLWIAKNSGDVYSFLNRGYERTWEDTGKFIFSCDVETICTVPSCIGLAFNRYEALSIPIFNKMTSENPLGIPMHDLTAIWKMLAEFFDDTKAGLLAWNAKFDEKRCRQIGLNWRETYFDAMLAWHTLYSELPKKLEFVTSMVTNEPYYKDEGKEYNPKKDRFDRLLLYNARDAAVTFECFEEIWKELKECNMLDWFFDNMMPLHRLYSDIEDVGILLDKDKQKELHKKYLEIRMEKYSKLKELVEHDINPNSPQQVAKLLFGELKCPVRKDTGENTLKALMNNVIKDQRRKDIIRLILELRKVSKTIGTYINVIPSSDGRVRTQYKITGAESGRTSTEKLEPPVSVVPCGLALQTMTKHEDVTLDTGGADLRSMFVADPGYIFIESDGSQAEDRVVAVLSKDWDALKLLEKKDFKYNKHGMKDDRHTLTTMLCCGISFEEVTDYYRQIGKRGRHAANYDVGKHELMVTLAKYGIYISEWKAGKILDLIHNANPKIRGIYHNEIIEALQANNCILTSPHGRIRQFFNKWGRDLFKEAFSYIPQATVSDHTKGAMLRAKSALSGELKICMESHDSFLGLVRIEIVNDAAKEIKKAMEVPINFSRCSLSRDYNLVIPCDTSIGYRWNELRKWKDGMDIQSIGRN